MTVKKPQFGTSSTQKMFRTLVSEVGVVFHSAATIRFDEKMTEVDEVHSS